MPGRARATTPRPQVAEKLAAATGDWADARHRSIGDRDRGDRPASSPRSGGHGSVAGTRTKLDRADYALPSLRRALELDPTTAPRTPRSPRRIARRRSGRISPTRCARTPRVETDVATKVDLLIGLGDLSETQLASTAKAIEAYQARRRDLDDDRHRRRASPRSSVCTAATRRGRTSPRSSTAAPRSARQAGDTGRAAAIRRELATLRAEKLGDLEGAIRATRPRSPPTAATRRRSRRSSISTTRPAAPRTTSARWSASATVAPEGEKLATLRKLAAELEDRDPDRARDAYEKLLAADPNADDAYRGLERVLEASSELVRARRRLEPPHRGREDAGAARRALSRGREDLRARARRSAQGDRRAAQRARDRGQEQDRAVGPAAALRPHRAVRPRGRHARPPRAARAATPGRGAATPRPAGSRSRT